MKSSVDNSKVFLEEVGENVKRRRKEKQLTLEQLGLEIGLTRMQVHRIEKGYNITLLTILKLSLALEIKPDLLLLTKFKFKKIDLERLINASKANKKAI